ncbi:2995_t:CDS:2, partial [Paraglomus brasilianum]
MLATWTPTERLVIFLCEDGTLFSDSMAPKEHLGNRSNHEYHNFGKMLIFKSTGEDVYATCDSDNNVP